MILTSAQDCTLITVESEQNIIGNIVTADGTFCCQALEIGSKCCSTNTILPIRSLYSFNAQIAGCGQEVVDNITYEYFDITIRGLDVSCVTSVTTQAINSDLETYTDLSDLTFRYRFNESPINATFNLTYDITTCNGLVYTFEVQLIFTPGDLCNTLTVDFQNTIYPDLPNGVTINNLNQIELSPEVVGMTDVFQDGVYFIGLTETDTATNSINNESETIFLDCFTTCKVVEYLTHNPHSNVGIYLDALKYSNDCDTVTYEKLCNLWTILGKTLGYFKVIPCEEELNNNCNCY
jgi:hypothetical protein